MKNISNKTIVTVGGILLIILGLFHIGFWNMFDWCNDLAKLRQDNSGIVQMMNICTICYLASMGIIILICRADITKSRIGRLLLLSLAVFFLVRLVMEFMFPGTTIVLAIILLLCIVVFLIPALRKPN